MKPLIVPYIVIWLILRFFGCHVGYSQSPMGKVTSDLHPPSSVQSNWKIMKPIELGEVKKMGKRYSTATILGNSKTKLFKRYSLNGFYGNYTLFFEEIERDKSVSSYAGELVVFCTRIPWVYENTEEQFIEILVMSDKIRIFDFLKVGMTKGQVLDFLGTPCFRKNDLILFEGEDGLFVSVLFKNQKVGKIKVGRYNQEIPKSQIIEYLVWTLNVVWIT